MHMPFIKYYAPGAQTWRVRELRIQILPNQLCISPMTHYQKINATERSGLATVVGIVWRHAAATTGKFSQYLIWGSIVVYIIGTGS